MTLLLAIPALALAAFLLGLLHDAGREIDAGVELLAPPSSLDTTADRHRAYEEER